jgi:hypothetical protein
MASITSPEKAEEYKDEAMAADDEGEGEVRIFID